MHGPAPSPRGVWIALNRKGIDYEKIDIDPSYEHKPPELLKANPKGTVPTIIHKGAKCPSSISFLQQVFCSYRGLKKSFFD